MRLLFLATCCFLFPSAPALGQPAKATEDIRELKLRDWEPKSMMVTKVSIVEKPMYPVIDMHNHLGGGKNTLTPDRVKRYLTEMNEAGVQTVVNLDGGWGDRLKETLAALDEAHPGRFLTYALINFENLDDADWGTREAKRLEESFKAGAKGLKFHKSLGLTVRHKDGTLVAVDDPKLDEVWEMCAKHGRPVVIHIADPAAFFTPLDKYNERWHELNSNPGWLFFGEKYPKREVLLDQLHRVIARHPKTTFINTHFGNNAEDLASVADKLDKYPNMYVDIDARISELGRQPYAARKFFLKYQDRILFGTDTTPRREAYRIYYRFLETEDEYFNCAASHHLQGFWNIYGINLPAPVLDKIYRRNAERVLYGLKPDASRPGPKELHVAEVEDFELKGDGSAEAWKKAEWQMLSKRNKDSLPYETKIKVLHSNKGLYVLMEATDEKLTSTITKDFQDLWKEDVFEVFLWPDDRDAMYFEYEISPLGYELPIIIPNLEGRFLGWLPWHYEGARKIRKATSALGGELKSGAKVTGWKAEFFIPYELMQPLRNVPPKAGTRWRANFYRMDYDNGKTSSWDWSRVGPSFHDFQKFGTLIFD
ncbi:amidohydrolase family protein [Telmatocola sphagniphila]|uniref:Amidohydrolase family protein n=1 Tax=Telmatocola sphagniphila TaxID=1123043 RepID=A0A8E6B3Q7_9BACT|nr:carbohydrate-binding family 9-like protein [Telmatocola sphagniphila]QVL30561.1 amidohydrolase family protein [Telmatocola sphagniphila]